MYSRTSAKNASVRPLFLRAGFLHAACDRPENVLRKSPTDTHSAHPSAHISQFRRDPRPRYLGGKMHWRSRCHRLRVPCAKKTHIFYGDRESFLLSVGKYWIWRGDILGKVHTKSSLKNGGWWLVKIMDKKVGTCMELQFLMNYIQNGNIWQSNFFLPAEWMISRIYNFCRNILNLLPEIFALAQENPHSNL